MKKRRIIWVCAVILLLILRFLPYEKWFIRFDTIEEAWNSAGNKEKIISKETIDNITFIAYINEDNVIGDSYIAKDDRGWIPQFSRFLDLKDCINPLDSSYSIVHWYDCKKHIIKISSFVLESKDQQVVDVKDNINTGFKHVRINYDNEYFDEWYAVIDNLPGDYSITIDGREYKF